MGVDRGLVISQADILIIMKVKKNTVRLEENAVGTTHFHVYFRIKYIDSSAVSQCACERFSKAKEE